MFIRKSSPSWRGLLGLAAICLATTTIAKPAQAAVHLWQIQEVYTNASGTLQFIEMFDAFGGNPLTTGQQIFVTNLANTQTNPFTLPGPNLAGNTFGHSLLFGTAGIQAAGAPAPDYIIPNGFLFQPGGTINFFGFNPGPYAALPTDGLLSRTWTGGNALNSPTNYAGATGLINGVPEPSTFALVAVGGMCGALLRWRRVGSRRGKPDAAELA